MLFRCVFPQTWFLLTQPAAGNELEEWAGRVELLFKTVYIALRNIFHTSPRYVTSALQALKVWAMGC